MSIRYRSIFPQSQQSTYQGNSTVDFYLSFEGEKLDPGSITIEGRSVAYLDRTGPTYPSGYTRMYNDPVCGAHQFFDNFLTEFAQIGLQETINNYPRLVKMTRLASKYDESVGTETDTAIEGSCASQRITKGLLEGVNGDTTAYPTATGAAIGRYVPFSIRPQIAVNKTTGPLSAAVTGTILIRLQLAPDNRVFNGEDVTANTSYDIADLRLRYRTLPDDGVRQPISMEMYHCYRTLLDSNNANLSTFVPGLCDSVHMSFINTTDENTLNRPYLACQPPIGQPPVGYSAIGTNLYDYGIERLTYAINDTDTALVGYTLISREEVLLNGLKSFNNPAVKYEGILRKLRNSTLSRRDGYLAGISFGGLLNFIQTKFACEIQSQCDNTTNQYAAYLFFRMTATLNA
jgi:hypothetical protein